MEEFMEYEEEFEARQSISSRGSHAQPGKSRDVVRNTGVIEQNGVKAEERHGNYNPQKNLHNYQDPNEGEENMSEYGDSFRDGQSSEVITEIVDEQVVEIETENEEELNQLENNQTEEVNQYLDNIKQEEYVNRDEYQEYDNQEGPSPDQQEREGEGDHQQYDQENGYNQEEGYNEEGEAYNEDGQYDQVNDQYQEEGHEYDQENQELDGEGQPIQDYDQEQNYQQMAENQYMMENSPIVENPLEEELTGSPQMYEAPRAVNPKYRRKHQGVDPNDKSHLIWEQERLERRRMEREMKRAHLWPKQYDTRDIDWHPTVNPKRAAYNIQKNPQKSSLWHFSNSSSVPMLSTAKSIKANAASKNERTKHDPREAQSKKDHRINNVFHQSSYQSMLSGKNGKIAAPTSHVSMKKELGRAFMTPIDNKYQNQNSVLEGRNRMFHSSNVF